MSKLFKAPEHPCLVGLDGDLRWHKLRTTPPKSAPAKAERQAQLLALQEEMSELQQKLYADNRHSLLLVFQAMDAAGKDSTIRAVLSGLDPAGCHVTSFKAPSSTELDHDFLWRTNMALPERGRIGVFNRSYYEEVLVVRVHPEYLEGQRLPRLPKKLNHLWEERLESIADHEKHLARNGTVVVKFFLNVSREEQRQRFLARINEPEKNWKFNAADVAERQHWDDYQEAYQAAIAATSKPHAPWYAIPADSKSWMQLQVAEIIVATLRAMDLQYPVADESDTARFDELRQQLLSEDA